MKEPKAQAVTFKYEDNDYSIWIHATKAEEDFLWTVHIDRRFREDPESNQYGESTYSDSGLKDLISEHLEI